MDVTAGTVRKWVAGLVAACLFFPGNGYAISIREETELSEQFMEQARGRYEFIEEPCIVDYVNRVGKRLVAVLPHQPFNYRFYVILDDSFNAFASPAGQIFVNSGLLAALDGESELAGILGHEVAHAACRHVSKSIDQARRQQPLTIAGMVAGILLGLGGGGALGQAAIVGSTAGARSLALAYSREAEDQADELGVRYLIQAGYPGDGLVKALKKIRERDWFESETPGYLSSHPPTVERLMHIDAALQRQPGRPAGSIGTNPDRGFAKARARLVGTYGPADRALALFADDLRKDPNDPMAHWGCGQALIRSGRYEEAIFHLTRARSADPGDIAIRTDLGKAYYSTGRYQEALEALAHGSDALSPDAERLFHLGYSQMKTGRLQEASDTLASLLKIHPDYTDAYYALGQIRHLQGLKGESHYYLGVYFKEKTKLPEARFHLEKALALMVDPNLQEKVRRVLGELGPQRGDPSMARRFQDKGA